MQVARFNLFFTRFNPNQVSAKRLSISLVPETIDSGCHSLRDMAFKLKPLSLSSDLIGQLRAMAVKLGEKADVLQKMITKGKNKNKHYKDEIGEVGDLKKLH